MATKKNATPRGEKWQSNLNDDHKPTTPCKAAPSGITETLCRACYLEGKTAPAVYKGIFVPFDHYGIVATYGMCEKHYLAITSRGKIKPCALLRRIEASILDLLDERARGLGTVGGMQ